MRSDNRGDHIVVTSRPPKKRYQLSSPMLNTTPGGKLDWHKIRFANTEENRIEHFECVVNVDGQWVEICCSICGANAWYKREEKAFVFFKGLTNHIKCHLPKPKTDGKGNDVPTSGSNKDVEAVCKLVQRRIVSQADVEALQEGRIPSVLIELREQPAVRASSNKRSRGGEANGVGQGEVTTPVQKKRKNARAPRTGTFPIDYGSDDDEELPNERKL